MKKHASTLLKIAITIIGLAYALNQVPLGDIADAFQNLDWRWVAVTFGLMVLGLFVRAYRWLMLLQGLHATTRFRRLVELYMVGNFFNTFLPSGFGGDVVRVLEVSQDVPNNVAAGTVIVDRLTGLMMLFALALVALPFRPDSFPPDLLWPIVGVSLIGLTGGFVLLEGSLIRRFGGWLPGKLSVTDEKQPLAKLLNAVQGCGWGAIGKALAVSAVFVGILAAWWMTAGFALGLHQISYTYFLLVIPILSVSMLAPSIGGLGVRETIAPLLFAGAGLPAGDAIALSLLVFIIQRMTGLLGGPLYIYTSLRDRSKTKKGLDTDFTDEH